MRRAPGRTSTGAPSRVSRELRRVGSRLGGVVTDTPDALVSTTSTSSPAGSRTTLANPPPSTTAEPDAVEPLSCTSARTAMPPNEDPPARPGSSFACSSADPAAARTADAITVGVKGPGATARPNSSTTTTSSGKP